MNVTLKKVESRNEKDELISTGFAIVKKTKDGDVYVCAELFATKDDAKEYADQHGLKLG